MFKRVIGAGLCFVVTSILSLYCLASSCPLQLSHSQLRAQDFVALLGQEKFSLASDEMDAHLRELLPAHVLQSLWESLQQDSGTFEDMQVLKAEPTRQRGVERVVVVAKFKQDILDFVMTINAGKIASFVVRPHPNFVEPSYAKKASFVEVPLDVVSGKFNLGATLCLPQGKGPFPAVVLVHASGPHDRDETVGAIKVFRDIAWGLASNGVAVLRYEKRSRQYPNERLLTVNEETVDDAVAAVKTLEAREEIDSKKVFVLGHSLGAVLVPRIAEQTANVAGFIVCAAPTQSLEDVIFSQVEFVERASGIGSDSKTIESARDEMKQVKQLSLESTKGGPLLGLERSWWLDMQKYDAVQATKKIQRPVLLMQGEKDYQVGLKDFATWKAAVSDKPNFTLKSYPNLSHAFAKAGDQPGPSDYLSPLNVSDEVIQDLAIWIKGAIH